MKGATKRFTIIGSCVVLLILGGCASSFLKTRKAILAIENLEGRKGDFVDLTKTIKTRYHQVESADKLEIARVKMGLTSVSNLLVFRFNGEGIPYFYGYVGYDTSVL